jgi:hypothetical protein
MAINKKSSKKVEKPGYPSEFVKLATDAATYSVTSKFFEEKFNDTKKGIVDYLNTENCPVVINVGEKGSNPKIDGVGTIIVSQPERLDNKEAVLKVVELLKDGKLNPDDLLELVSTVNKEALSKVVDRETLDSLVKKDDAGEVALMISVRVAAEFKMDLTAALEENVAAALQEVA